MIRPSAGTRPKLAAIVVVVLSLAAVATVPIAAGATVPTSLTTATTAATIVPTSTNIVTTAAAATPDTSCAGSGGGAIFVADSGFTVEYNDSQPMPDDGPFRDAETIRFRNVTLSSSGDAFLRLENGTGPETCLAAVDATPSTVRVDPDGEQAILIDGAVDALSFADADYAQGSMDLSYDASGGWTLTIPSTGLSAGTEVVAEDGSGTKLATGTVDSTGQLTLSLQAGTYDVDLRESTSNISIMSVNTSTSAVLVGETVNVTVELHNDGDKSGDYTATLTSDGQDVANRTMTVDAGANETIVMNTSFSQAGTYTLAVDGQTAGDVTVSEPTAAISVTAASTSTSAVTVGETVDVTVELQNDGSASGDYTATLTSDGQDVATRTVTVDAGANETVTMNTSFNQAGTYTLAVDGQTAGEVTVAEPTADISVTSATPSLSAVLAGEAVDVTVELRNDGSASGDYTATLTVDGQSVADETVTVGAGATETITMTTSFSQAGTYSLAVDGQDAGQVTVTEPSAQISVVSVTPPSSDFAVGETVEVTVELRNDGDASGEHTVTLTADGEVLTQETVTVGPNTNKTVTLSTSFDTAGAYSISVDGQDAGEVSISESEPTDGADDSTAQQDSSEDGGPPWLIILAIVAVLAGVGGYLLARRGNDGSPPPSRETERPVSGESAAGYGTEDTAPPTDDGGAGSDGGDAGESGPGGDAGESGSGSDAGGSGSGGDAGESGSGNDAGGSDSGGEAGGSGSGGEAGGSESSDSGSAGHGGDEPGA